MVSTGHRLQTSSSEMADLESLSQWMYIMIARPQCLLTSSQKKKKQKERMKEKEINQYARHTFSTNNIVCSVLKPLKSVCPRLAVYSCLFCCSTKMLTPHFLLFLTFNGIMINLWDSCIWHCFSFYFTPCFLHSLLFFFSHPSFPCFTIIFVLCYLLSFSPSSLLFLLL